MTERKIFFRQLMLTVPIGIHPEELAAPQRIAVDIDLHLRPGRTDIGDDIANVLDYDRIRRGVEALATGRRICLQETLAESIATFCLGFEQVASVRVATGKPDIYPDCALVGYEVRRTRPADPE